MYYRQDYADAGVPMLPVVYGDRIAARVIFAHTVALVLLATESLRIVSATRAYVGGESLWSKAQKEAVYSLFRYAQTRSESDYADYRKAIAVPLAWRARGDRESYPRPK